jgi:peptide/nickel transport system substrate-binding protein
LGCCSSSTRSFCSSSERVARLALLLAALLAPALLAACGADEVAPGPDPSAAPEPVGSIRYALARPVRTLDPLAGGNRSERLIARQVFEPLVGRQPGPFGAAPGRAGLARSLRPSGDGRIWTARLRRGVRFHNGESLDADTVLANVDRWLSSATTARLIPELIAADSPKPGQVRFQLSRPRAGLPRILANGRFGIVAAGTLPDLAGRSLRRYDGGSGPFELRERGRSRVVLARNSEWWGTDLGLGPGVDSFELGRVPAAGQRLAALERGAVEVADQVPAGATRRLARDPLLSSLSDPGVTIGIERSVRGIDSTRADRSLAPVWLTDLR